METPEEAGFSIMQLASRQGMRKAKRFLRRQGEEDVCIASFGKMEHATEESS